MRWGGMGGHPDDITQYIYLQLDIFFDIEIRGSIKVSLDLPCPEHRTIGHPMCRAVLKKVMHSECASTYID